MVGRLALEDLARVGCEVELGSELRYRNPLWGPETLTLSVSQSGETADTLAAIKAAKSRFRPILMTAFSFILGVFPLVVAAGSGAEARKVMGMALLGGMTIATLLGVFLYPMLYVMIGKLFGYEKKRDKELETAE